MFNYRQWQNVDSSKCDINFIVEREEYSLEASNSVVLICIDPESSTITSQSIDLTTGKYTFNNEVIIPEATIINAVYDNVYRILIVIQETQAPWLNSQFEF